MTHELHTHGAGGVQQLRRGESSDAFEAWCDQNEETVLCAVYNALVENPDDHPFTVGQITQMRHDIENRLYEKHCADLEAGED